MAQDGPKRAPKSILRDLLVAWRPFLGPSWAILGPPWPFLGGPGGHLEADVGLGRLASGVQGGQKLDVKNMIFFPRGKINVFGCFLEARGLQKACKVAVWRSCCGFDALKRAT